MYKNIQKQSALKLKDLVDYQVRRLGPVPTLPQTGY